jgi:hypothetical protein
MFWNAVGHGLSMLLYWETYAASGLFIVFLLVPLVLVGMLAEKDMRIGCVGMLVLPVFQSLATMMVMFTLSPIIFGIATDAAWALPWHALVQNPGGMVKGAIFLAIIAVVSAFVPIIGRSTTFTNMLIGAVAISWVLRAIPTSESWQIDYMPPFWTGVGLLVVGGITSFASTLAIAAIQTLRAGADRQATPGPLSMALFGVLGLIPAFMYGAWLGQQIPPLRG